MVTSLHQILKRSTEDIHARMHVHPGFSAIADGTIDLPAYRALLCRLFGFYVAFELSISAPRSRSIWLEQDLLSLDMPKSLIGSIALCTSLPSLDTPEQCLGAQYVVEGAALGGRQLAANLDHLLGSDGILGRRFFVGHGENTGVRWRAFIAGLSSGRDGAEETETVAAAARSTFLSFEAWLEDWDKGSL